MFKAAVIAGTPVDTRMGVEYIERRNAACGSIVCEPVYLPVSEDCDEQVKFQYSDYETKRARMDEIFDSAIGEGIRDFFIYCNSLSGAFDFEQYAAEKSGETGEEIRVYTPLQIYRYLGSQFRRIGVVAANNLSAHNIEKNLMLSNPDIYMIGSGNMAIVNAIEQGMPPADIIEKCGLLHMISYMKACGSEALLLGCTHFPYLTEELEKVCDLKVIDPVDEMFDRMLAANE